MWSWGTWMCGVCHIIWLTCDVTHCSVGHDSLWGLVCDITYSWLLDRFNRCDSGRRECVVFILWHDACVTWLTCDMARVWHDSCVTWLMCTMTHVWHDACVTRLTCDVTHSSVRYDSSIAVTDVELGGSAFVLSISVLWNDDTRQIKTMMCPKWSVLRYLSYEKKKSLANPKSTSNQSSKPCTVLQYPSREVSWDICLYEKMTGYGMSLVSSFHTTDISK